MERVTSIVAVKSVVDLSKIDFSTFLNLYQGQLLETKMTHEELKEALNQAKEIYKDYKFINDMTVAKTASLVRKPPHGQLINSEQRFCQASVLVFCSVVSLLQMVD